MKKRMLSQDIAKGLGMFAVVQLHAWQLSKELFYPIVAVLGFVMPFYFFMSGYNYRSKGLSPIEGMKKRVSAIFKAYAVHTLAVGLVMGLYFFLHKDGTLPEILHSFAASVISESGTKLLGWTMPVSMFQHVLFPYWYLQYLITASILFYLLVEYALRSISRLFSIVVLLSACTFLFVQLHITLPWGLHCAPLLAAVMILGARLGQNNQFFTAASTPFWVVLNSVVSLVLCDLIQISFPAAGIFGAGLLGEVAGSIEILFTLCFAVFGSYFLIQFSRLLEKVPVLSTALIWCGQHSLAILCLHRPIAYLIRDFMGLPHFISGNPLYIDRMTAENFLAFVLVYVIMVPMILIWERLKAKRA